MSALLAGVPLLYRLLALAALAVALVGYGWLKGAQHGERKLDAAEAKALKEGVRIVTLRGAVTTRIETKYLPQLARTEVITETIVKEVPVYVPRTDPDLSGGFRVLHDAAAAGRVPDPAGIADAAPVPAQDVASTVAANYGQCRQDQLKLQGLQEWVTEQLKVR
jgi:hypothetical protein